MAHISVIGFVSVLAVFAGEKGRDRAVKVSKMLSSLGDHLRVGASVRNVYGEPVVAVERTVIPIRPRGLWLRQVVERVGAPETAADRPGSGGGAGMSARPVGALEITEAGTRFIPFIDPIRLGMALMIGLCIGFAALGVADRRRGEL